METHHENAKRNGSKACDRVIKQVGIGYGNIS